jgi:hypothetical protein
VDEYLVAVRQVAGCCSTKAGAGACDQYGFRHGVSFLLAFNSYFFAFYDPPAADSITKTRNIESTKIISYFFVFFPPRQDAFVTNMFFLAPR